MTFAHRAVAAAQQLDGADPASQVFGIGAILVLAGRAAHLEAVRRRKRGTRRERWHNHTTHLPTLISRTSSALFSLPLGWTSPRGEASSQRNNGSTGTLSVTAETSLTPPWLRHGRRSQLPLKTHSLFLAPPASKTP